MTIAFDIFKDETLIFLDLETTGLNSTTDKIIEIGAIKVRNQKVIDKFHTLINPQVPLPTFITYLTKIREEDLKRKPTIEEEDEEVFKFLGKDLIVCHNASFEKSFLEAVKGGPVNNIFIDSCELATLLYPSLGSYSLESLMRFFKIKETEAHRALIDSEDTFRLWTRIFEGLGAEDLERIKVINDLLSKTKLPLKRVFDDLYKSMQLRFKDEDKSERKEVVSDKEKELPRGRKELIDKSTVEEIFKKEGLLSKNLENFEARTEQISMVRGVVEAFNNDKILVIEAGTGVGKSLGYLVPVVKFYFENKEKVVISTNTKNLQDQLISKDIPLVKRILKVNFKTALLKGRSNYLCLKKVNELFEDWRSFDDEGKFALAYLFSFCCRNESGQLSEISSYLLRKNKYLEKFKNYLVSEASFCLGGKCLYFKKCFYWQMINSAQAADILIANHSLIFSQPQWMPDYTHLILDEAHNIEDAATHALTEELSGNDLDLLLEELMDEKEKKGLYFNLRKKEYKITQQLKELKEDISRAKIALLHFSHSLCSLSYLGQRGFGVKVVSRSLKELKKELQFMSVSETHAKLVNSLRSLIANLFLLSHLPELNFKDRLKVAGFAQKIEESEQILKELTAGDEAGKINWVEFNLVRKRRGSLISWKFLCAPLEVAKFLAELVFQGLKTVVLTSGTLSVGGDFSFLSERIGLDLIDKDRIIYKVIGSPFDFEKHTILGIPKDFPQYNYNEAKEFACALADGIKRIVLDIKGKNLALFSSRKRMESVYLKIKDSLENQGFIVFCQGLDGSRYFLMKQLKETRQNILVFGSRSFQEGIDVSGLSAVIIDKLSFPHRKDPIVSARRDFLLKKGKNPFRDYELPLAVISLRQGFGRLIRRRSDFGLVVIFDSRLLDRDYKEYVIKSLPQTQLVALGRQEFYSSLRRKFLSLKEKRGLE